MVNQIQKEGKGLPMSAGYSYKQSKELVGPQFWIMPWPMPGQPENQNLEKINNQFRRIVVRIGVDL